MSINQRVTEIINNLFNGNKRAFAMHIGVNPSVIENIVGKRQSAPSFDITNKILTSIEHINTNWLMLGKGEMLLPDENTAPPVCKPEQEEETRPRIPFDAAAGSLSIALDGITKEQAEQVPVIRAFSKYDFTIIAKGDSMFPDVHSGDEMACLYVRPMSFIQWGRFHVLDTSQGVIVKRIFDDDEYILCKSENSDLYKDFRIHKSEVYNLALVIGLIRRY